jgi:hypothetical protein
MAFDEKLAGRIRATIGDEPALTETRMFGGLAFLIGGNMSVAASSKGGLLLRVEPARTMTLAKKPGARPMEMRGKPMEGWLRVDADAVRTQKALASWVQIGVAYARSLPAKKSRAARSAPGRRRAR